MLDKYDGFRFLHLRNKIVEITGVAEVAGVYVQDFVSPFGGRTVAYRVVEGQVEVRVARCSPEDRYERKIGRECALKAPSTFLPMAGFFTAEERAHFFATKDRYIVKHVSLEIL